MEKKILFYSGPGLKLVGILKSADDRMASDVKPGVVLCHAGTGTKETFLPEISQRLVSNGYVVLRFDYRGFGESEGHESRLIPWEQGDDIRSAITFMQLQDGVDRKRIS
jgi:alpha/beta superfamily hydrolase